MTSSPPPRSTTRPPRVVVFSGIASPVVAPLASAGVDMVGVVEFGTGRQLRKRARSLVTGWKALLSGRPQPPVLSVRSMTDPRLRAWLEDRVADVLVIYRVPKIPAEVFTAARFAINLHPSLLPSYRGGHPLLWAVWDQRSVTGCTVHLIDEKLDVGPIVLQQSFSIPSGVAEAELERFAVLDIGVPLLARACHQLHGGTATLTPQPNRSPTPLARRRSRSEIYSSIRFDEWSVERVWRVLRFLSLTPVEFRPLLRLPGLDWHVGEIDHRPGNGHPGTLQIDEAGPYVSCPRGRIRLTLRRPPPVIAPTPRPMSQPTSYPA